MKANFLQLRAMAKVAVSNLAMTYAGFHLTISGLLWLCHNIVTVHSQSKTLCFAKRKRKRISIVLTSLFIHKGLNPLVHNHNLLCHCSTNRSLRTSGLRHLAVAALRLQNNIHHSRFTRLKYYLHTVAVDPCKFHHLCHLHCVLVRHFMETSILSN